MPVKRLRRPLRFVLASSSCDRWVIRKESNLFGNATTLLTTFSLYLIVHCFIVLSWVGLQLRLQPIKEFNKPVFYQVSHVFKSMITRVSMLKTNCWFLFFRQTSNLHVAVHGRSVRFLKLVGGSLGVFCLPLPERPKVPVERLWRPLRFVAASSFCGR